MGPSEAKDNNVIGGAAGGEGKLMIHGETVGEAKANT
jgi:hypothetical protein